MLLNITNISRIQRGVRGFSTKSHLRFGNSNLKKTGVSTDKIATRVGEDFFVKNERLARPISPHMNIYAYQWSWCMSGLHRATGTGLALATYGVFILAAVTSISSGDVVSAVYANVPGPIIFAGKFFAGACFSFKALSGMRHLIWDTTTLVNNKGVTKSSYVIVGMTAVGAIYLALCD